MERLKTVQELRDALGNLRLTSAALKTNFAALENFIDQEKFPSAEVMVAASDDLLKWINGANKCFELYEKIFESKAPQTFSELENFLDAEEKKIREESIFGQAENFLRFVATSPDLKKFLGEHQVKLKKLLARQNFSTPRKIPTSRRNFLSPRSSVNFSATNSSGADFSAKS